MSLGRQRALEALEAAGQREAREAGVGARPCPDSFDAVCAAGAAWDDAGGCPLAGCAAAGASAIAGGADGGGAGTGAVATGGGFGFQPHFDVVIARKDEAVIERLVMIGRHMQAMNTGRRMSDDER